MRTMILVFIAVIFATTAICATAQIPAVSPAGGGALHLTGQDAAVAKDNNSLDLELDGNFTIEAWIYIEEMPRGDDRWTIVAKPGSYEWIIVGPRHKFAIVGRAVPQEYVFTFLVLPNVCGFNLDSTTIERTLGEKDITEEWHHFTIVVEPTRSAWVFDGRNMGGAPFGCFIPDSDSELYVGGDPKQPRSFFKGSIDELRISSRKRTMALWHFDEPGRIFQDSANGNVLVLPEGALLPRGRLSVDLSGKLATKWAAIKSKR